MEETVAWVHQLRSALVWGLVVVDAVIVGMVVRVVREVLQVLGGTVHTALVPQGILDLEDHTKVVVVLHTAALGGNHQVHHDPIEEDHRIGEDMVRVGIVAVEDLVEEEQLAEVAVGFAGVVGFVVVKSGESDKGVEDAIQTIEMRSVSR